MAAIVQGKSFAVTSEESVKFSNIYTLVFFTCNNPVSLLSHHGKKAAVVSKCHPIAKDDSACATYYNLDAHREPGSLGTTPS